MWRISGPPHLRGNEKRRVQLNMERAPSAFRRFEMAPRLTPAARPRMHQLGL